MRFFIACACLVLFEVSGTTILLHKPTPASLTPLYERYHDAPFNHEHALCLLPTEQQVIPTHIPKGYKIIRLRRILGQGEITFERASQALLGWHMHAGSATAGVVLPGKHCPTAVGAPTTEPLGRNSHGGGGALFTYARTLGLWSCNPCRITHQIWDRVTSSSRSGREPTLFSAVGYATLEGHVLQGCETMVIYTPFKPKSGKRARQASDQGGDVVFELVSISKCSGRFGQLLFPAIAGRTQQAFFQEQADTMARLVRIDS